MQQIESIHQSSNAAFSIFLHILHHAIADNDVTMNHRPLSYSYRLFYIFAFLLSIPSLIEAANWAQLAGKRAQKITKPYIPQNFYAYKYTQRTSSSTSTSSNVKSMWSPRWGHAVVVLNQTSTYRNDLSVQENSQRVVGLVPKLFVLGGDDYTVGECISFIFSVV